ncbi:hypothetical protein [Klebsiella pneumoniae]|uniref:hypothetical protein n=1 Tax=Klebsiella pneumoniae TaxID=573 RepID=UPI00287BFFF1|nr:hypothetical protein [Klebsiella pneumoniae]MDS6699252.1 hypothetical protein [Klebsiella pneumoniae]
MTHDEPCSMAPDDKHDLISGTCSHLPLVNLHFPYKFRESESLKSFLANEVKEGKNADKNVNQYKSKFFAK